MVVSEEDASRSKIILSIPSIHTSRLTGQVEKRARQKHSQDKTAAQETHELEHQNQKKADD